MRIFAVLTALLLACLGGCAKSKLPIATSSMADIYAGVETVNPEADSKAPARAGIEKPYHGRDLSDAGSDLTGFTRSEATELTTRFARVPNPTLAMYVFPHLSGQLPVPGYITTFPLWDSAPYALPGETATATDTIDP